MLASVSKDHGVDITPDQMEGYVKGEEDIVISRLSQHLDPCAGVNEVLAEVDGKYTLAVVSSSALRRVQVCLDKTGQAKYFGKRVYSAATSLPTPTSKPDPAIYLHAIGDLGRKASECVAIEDSKSGTLSAVRAGIKAIGYVGAYPEGERADMTVVLKDAGASVIMNEWDEFSSCMAALGTAA
jgi:HAD superfamily hydrolase (TIGR01509 family)